MALTAKQKAFCEAMVELNHNQMASYRKAFPDANDRTVQSNANRLMKKDEIIEYINALEKEAWKQAGITPERIAKELAKMAFAEIDENNTATTKQNAMKLLQIQMGLDKKIIEAKGIDINITLNDNDTDKS